MLIEATLGQVAQLLLWPVLVGVCLALLFALWSAGRLLMEGWQRRHGLAALGDPSGRSLEALELAAVEQLEPVRLLARLCPLLGLIATMIPLGPALQRVAAGQGQQALAVFSGAFSGVVVALAAAAIGLTVYSIRRRWLMAELLAVRQSRGLA